MAEHKVFQMDFGKIYGLLLDKPARGKPMEKILRAPEGGET